MDREPFLTWKDLLQDLCVAMHRLKCRIRSCCCSNMILESMIIPDCIASCKAADRLFRYASSILSFTFRTFASLAA